MKNKREKCLEAFAPAPCVSNCCRELTSCRTRALAAPAVSLLSFPFGFFSYHTHETRYFSFLSRARCLQCSKDYNKNKNYFTIATITCTSVCTCARCDPMRPCVCVQLNVDRWTECACVCSSGGKNSTQSLLFTLCAITFSPFGKRVCAALVARAVAETESRKTINYAQNLHKHE